MPGRLLLRRQVNRGCLCSRVVVPSQSCSHSVDARDVDDAAHSLYGHDERRIFHAGEDGTQVHGYNRIELFQINVSNGGELRASPGVVYQAIEAAKAVDSMVDHCLDVCFDGDIRAYETRGRAELLRESLAPLFASAGNHDLCAFGDENLRGAGANAARPARY